MSPTFLLKYNKDKDQYHIGTWSGQKRIVTVLHEEPDYYYSTIRSSTRLKIQNQNAHREAAGTIWCCADGYANAFMDA
jgi:hypothetical protein